MSSNEQAYNFEDVSISTILNLFGVIFYGIILQMTSNLYKSFISDEIKLSLKKISSSKSFLVYTLMK